MRVGLLVVLSIALAACGGGDDAADAGTPDGGFLPDEPCHVTAPTSCPAPATTYADIEPIVRVRCVHCHANDPMGPWPLDDYAHVADWQDAVRDDVLSCAMPPPDAGVGITNAERQAILQWVRCGAKP